MKNKLKFLLPLFSGILFFVFATNVSAAKYWWPVGSKDPNPANSNIYGGTPVTTWISCNYGYYSDGSPHNGTDIGVSVGTTIIAAEDGKVVVACHVGDGGSCEWSYGNYVKIYHNDGNFTLYGHMSQLDVTNGQTVSRGEKIGLSGESGNVSGPHLHFEVYVGAPADDPYNGYTHRVNPENTYISASDTRPTAHTAGSGNGSGNSSSGGNGASDEVVVPGGTISDIVDVEKPEDENVLWPTDIKNEFCVRTSQVWQFAGYALFALKILAPLLIIILGSIDFFKAVTASDDKAIKTAGMTLVQRLIMGVAIFFVPTIASLILNLVTEYANKKDDTVGCWSCLLSPTGSECKGEITKLKNIE